MSEAVTVGVGSTTDATFDARVLGADRPVLVEFWAAWCGPCHLMAPVLAQIAADRSGELDVVKIDADANPVTMQRYGVLGLPTMILFDGGEPVRSVIGARSRSRLLRDLDDALGGSVA